VLTSTTDEGHELTEAGVHLLSAHVPPDLLSRLTYAVKVGVRLEDPRDGPLAHVFAREAASFSVELEVPDQEPLLGVGSRADSLERRGRQEPDSRQSLTTSPTTAAPSRAPSGPAALDGAVTVTVTDTPPGIRALVRDAWRERRMAPQLGTRVLVKLIWGTKLGVWWLVLRPLMDTLGKALIFGALLGVTAPGGVPYFIYLLAGLIAWRLFDRLILYATRSFDFYRKVMTQIDFPLLLAPLSSAAFPVVEITVYITIFLGAVAYYSLLDGRLYLNLSATTPAALGGLAILVATGCGIGFWTSVLHGKARDVRLVMRYVTEFWLYLTPVVYPLTAIPPAYQVIATINPVTAPVEMVKLGLLGLGDVRLYPTLWSIAFALLMVISGLWFFSREARRSVDVHGPGADEDEDEG